MRTSHSSSRPGGSPHPPDQAPPLLLEPGTCPRNQAPPGTRHPLPGKTEFLTHTCENITLPQISFAGGNYAISPFQDTRFLFQSLPRYTSASPQSFDNPPVSITITDWTFIGSYLRFVDVDVNITNCDTSQSTLIAESRHNHPSHFRFCNTAIGKETFRNVEKLTMSHCQMVNVDSGFQDDISMFNIINTTTFIEDLTVYNQTCDICLRITGGSYVILRDSAFINNSATYGLVTMNDDSSLTTERCEFSDNAVESFGGALRLSSGFARIEETTFRNNSAPTGGAIFLENGSSLSVRISNFTGNRAVLGGAIYAKNNAQLTIGDSYFISNVANQRRRLTTPQPFSKKRPKNLSSDGFSYRITGTPSIRSNTFSPDLQYNGGAVLCAQYCNMNIHSSLFSRNYGSTFGGSVVAVANSNVTVQHSNFHGNKAGDSGGSIAVENDVSLVLSGCNFTGNSAPYGSAGAIYARNHSNVEITGTLIQNNSARKFGGALMVMEHVSLKMAAVVLDSNSIHMIGGAIYVQDYCDVVLQRCRLARNVERLLYGSAIATLSYSTLTITETVVSENVAGSIGGAIIVQGYCDVMINTTSFNNNLRSSLMALNNVTVSLTSSEFHNNSRGMMGGTVYANQYVTLRVHQALFDGNSVVYCGGAIYADRHGSVMVEDSEFRNNDAIAVYHSTRILIRNSTLVKNMASNGFGGAMVAVSSTYLVMTDSVLEDNACEDHGGAISMRDKSQGFLRYVIFSGNVAEIDGGAIEVIHSDLQTDYCLFENNSAVRGSGGAIFVLNMYKARHA